jgi:hypothetical protein
MTDLEKAIDQAIAETGVERYRHLCLSHPDPQVRERYSRWILAGRPSEPIKVDYAVSEAKPCGGC